MTPVDLPEQTLTWPPTPRRGVSRNAIPIAASADLHERLRPVVESVLADAGVVLPPLVSHRVVIALAAELHRDLGIT